MHLGRGLAKVAPVLSISALGEAVRHLSWDMGSPTHSHCEDLPEAGCCLAHAAPAVTRSQEGLNLAVGAPKQNGVLGANKYTAPAKCSAPQLVVLL